jgi:hypothetical protein
MLHTKHVMIDACTCQENVADKNARNAIFAAL